MKQQYIMKDDNIRNIWEEFVEKNKKHFLSNQEEWM